MKMRYNPGTATAKAPMRQMLKNLPFIQQAPYKNVLSVYALLLSSALHGLGVYRASAG